MATWVILGGQKQDTLKVFLATNTIGIQYWTDSVDLMDVGLEALKEQIKRNYGEHIAPKEPLPNVISRFANQVWAFLHDIQVGDTILMPTSRGSAAYVGYVEEGYECRAVEPLPHRRNVRWTCMVDNKPLGNMKTKRQTVFKLTDAGV